jgi:hypothetical protein
MKDFSPIYLQLNQKIKELHLEILKQNNMKAYAISIKITDLAQKLEDVMQANANIQ